MPCRVGGSAWQSWSPLEVAKSSSVLPGSRTLPSRFVRTQRARCAHDLSSFPERTSHAKLKSLNIDAPDGQSTPVRVQGLVRSIRKHKRHAFLHVADGTTYEPIQAIIRPDKAESLQTGAYVDVIGQWQNSPAKGQDKELQVDDLVLVGGSNAEDNPIQPKATTAEFLRTVPHMRMRTAKQSLILRTRSNLIRGVGDYFETASDPAVQVHPPLVTSSDCEGAGEVFTIAPQSASVPRPMAAIGSGQTPELDHFFGEPKYLTVSSQLHLEAFSAELGNVWTLSPTFRAEQSDTSRHLAEFYMLEAEFRGAHDLANVIDQAEDLIRHLASHLANSRVGAEHLAHYHHLKRNLNTPEEQAALPNPETRWNKLLTPSWPRITYRDAIAQLRSAHAGRRPFTLAPTWDTGLSLEHERFIVTHMFQNQTPVVVTHYPDEQKPFYMKAGPDTPPGDPVDIGLATANREPTAECFDILLPDGYAEVCGGSLREHRLDTLLDKMRVRGMLQPSTPTQAVEDHTITDTDTDTASSSASTSASPYPGLKPGESLGALKWYADLRRFGSSPHGGFGIGWDRLLAYLCCVANVRDVVAFPRAWGRADC